MRKSLLIVRANVRRAKGQAAAIVVLIVLAALMLNLGLMLSMDYKRNFVRYHDKLNAEHVTLALCGDDAGLREYVEEVLKEDAHTVQYCMDDAMVMVGSFAYNGGEINTVFVVLEKEAALNRPVGRVEIVEEGGAASGVYLPMLYGTDPDISVGEIIDITIGSSVESFTVCGFFNSVMTGSHNCSMMALVLTADKYEELEGKGILSKSTLASVRIDNAAESDELEAALKNKVSAQYPEVLALSNSYNLVTSSRYISQMICSCIMNVMAFIVTLIALVVIASNVINYIQENMQNIGALKAVGYKSVQIISTLLLQFLGEALAAAAAGIGLSYFVFPAVNDMMVSQTGIPYEVRFLALPAAGTAAAIGGAVALSVCLSSRRIKKIEPIVALRQGIQTHNYKRSHIPLDKTQMPIQLALALKTTFSGMKQNITVCITMLVLSLVVVFSGLMTENMIVDMQPFLEMIVGETADCCISVNAGIEEEFVRRMEADSRVEKIYLYNTIEVRQVGGLALMATMSEDFAQVNNQNVCFEGRFPKYDNEVAIGAKYAREKGLEIGDEITLTAEGNEADYIISGFTQISNNLGKDCLLTRSGYERMGRLNEASYYINMAEGVDIDAFREEVGEEFGNDVNASINILSVIEGSAAVYVSLMTIIVIAILVLSVIVIVFVLYLLVRTMLNNKKRDYGIMKALGFTSGQLVLQTAASFMPAVIFSTVVGIALSSVVVNPLTAIFLSGIGIVKSTFAVPAGFNVAAGAGLILFTFAAACLLSLKVRKIAPRVLLAE